MNVFEQQLEEAARRSVRNPLPEDTLGPDGLWYCGVCRKPKQAKIKWFGGTQRTVGVACDCCRKAEEERKRQEQEERARRRIQALRKRGITDGKYARNLFAADSSPDSKASRVARRYVEAWELMAQGNHGLLFYGPPGTGKTFYACSIANALIDRGIFALVTSVPQILNFQGGYEADGAMRSELAAADLLVLDDLGAQRDTSFAAEKVYDVIDLRYRAGKPLIVTTNLTPAEMGSAEIAYRRIYDRVFEMCDMRMKLDSGNHRPEAAARKRREAVRILSEVSDG